MKILLVYPKYPDTFWSLKHALKFISKRATHPPLGLLTVAALLPKEWSKKLVDMNVTPLGDRDIEWADLVFVSAMSIQKASVEEVIGRCKRLGVAVVAGGPLFTTDHEGFKGIDHLVLNEAEVTLPLFLRDLENGRAKRLYTSREFPDLERTPIPLWELIDMKKYATMSIQYSRGCPFNCEFCDISVLYGRKVRTKNKDRLLAELESLYAHGWRGDVFFVDDNFIGNRRALKAEILPAIIEWMENRKYPFCFNTEASVDLSDDERLMQLMVNAGFISVFVGIETPNEESLAECNKVQNKNRDLIGSVKKLQRSGLYVTGGFIVGFDNDPPSIFERLIAFIQESGIVTAMVGLLNAPRGLRPGCPIAKGIQAGAKEGVSLSPQSSERILQIHFRPGYQGQRKELLLEALSLVIVQTSAALSFGDDVCNLWIQSPEGFRKLPLKGSLRLDLNGLLPLTSSEDSAHFLPGLQCYNGETIEKGG